MSKRMSLTDEDNMKKKHFIYKMITLTNQTFSIRITSADDFNDAYECANKIKKQFEEVNGIELRLQYIRECKS